VNIKNQLYQICLENINKRISTIEKRLNAMVEARNSETKCVVGDKHETGRTMMHLEEEKSRMQYMEVVKERENLLKIDCEKDYEKVEVGSLVNTSNGDFFITIGIGRVILGNKTYYCISQVSPIGLKMIGKSIGETFVFSNTPITIKSIL